MERKGFLYSIVFLLSAFFIGCAPSMQLTVKRPAEVNLKSYKKIAMGKVDNMNRTKHTTAKRIESIFVDKLFESGSFEVLDRQNVDKLIQEQKLGASGLIDESTAAQIGQIIGVSAMIFGKVLEEDYDEQTSSSEYKSKEGRKWIYKREGRLSILVNFSIVDVSTGKVVVTKTLQGKKYSKTAAEGEKAPPIDVNKLYESCYNTIGNNFRKMIAPYDINIKVSFESDASLPELDQALTNIKIGEWDEGVNILKKATERGNLNPKVLAKAHYNYGMLVMYGGNYDEAINSLKKANQLVPENKKYVDAIVLARKEKEQAIKLSQQTE